MKNHLDWKARKEGEDAYYVNKKEKDNPYPFQKGFYHLRAEWFEGFKMAKDLEEGLQFWYERR